MKKILDFCKAAWRGVLINIIGMIMIWVGMVLMYNHIISDEFLLLIVSFTLVYFGVPLLRRNVFKFSDKEKAKLFVAYALAYMSYKKGYKQEDLHFTFEEEVSELKTIREFIDNNIIAVSSKEQIEKL